MNIELDKNCRNDCGAILYKRILDSKLYNIFQRLKETFPRVQWIIYTPQKPPDAPVGFQKQSPQNIVDQAYREAVKAIVYIPQAGKEYGFCYPSLNQVFISTKALQKHEPTPQLDVFVPIKSLHREPNLSLLTKVIVDELAHIATGEDHGTPRYEQVHKTFKRLCDGL